MTRPRRGARACVESVLIVLAWAAAGCQPAITSLEGNGSTPGRFGDAIVLHGNNFSSGEVTLTKVPAGSPVILALRSASATLVEAVLPADASAADYNVKITTPFGSAEQSVTLLQGEPGPAGPPGSPGPPGPPGPSGGGASNYFKTTGAYANGCNGGTNTVAQRWIGAGGACDGTLLTFTTNGNPLLVSLSLTGYWTSNTSASFDFTNANVLVQLKTSTGDIVTQEHNQWGSTGRNSTGDMLTSALTFTEIATLPAGTHAIELWGRIQNGDSLSPKFNMDSGNGVSISVVQLGTGS